MLQYREKTCSILGRNEGSFAEGLLRVWQKIFIDHRNDNRANRASLKSLWGSRYSRMCTSTTTCARITKCKYGGSLKSWWVGWKYFNRPLVQQIWGEPRGASATAHNLNTFEKYIWEIQLRSTVEKYSQPLLITVSIGRRNTLWGARYLLVEGPHTGEYSEHAGEFSKY